MNIIPTNYQREALKRIKESKDLFNSSTIIQMASGLGKTYLAGFESMNYIGKILFICHRKEILKQALNVFSKIYEILKSLPEDSLYKKTWNLINDFDSIIEWFLMTGQN